MPFVVSMRTRYILGAGRDHSESCGSCSARERSSGATACGASGLGWTVQHLSQLFDQSSFSGEDQLNMDIDTEEAAEEDSTADIDAAVLRRLGRFNPDTSFDLISGLVEFGVYFLERLPGKTAIEGIEAVFTRFEKLAERTPAGITWHSGPALLPEWQRAFCPNGYYNLGVAHGIPGIIHFLSEVTSLAIIDKKRSYGLLEGAVDWLIAQQHAPGYRSTFTAWMVPGEEPAESRLAWCYGDIGILSVLLQVARCAERDDWHKFASMLLDRCLAWDANESRVVDAPLCHGAAGVAHIFNRIYHNENDQRCRNAALAWLERTLAMRQPGTGVGGFSALTRSDRDAPIVWDPSPSFLDGAIGVALALLATITSTDPSWDRMLLLSGRSSLRSQFSFKLTKIDLALTTT